MDLVVLINVARGSSTSLMEAKSCGWLILHNFHHNEALSKKHARKRASARTHACREGMMGEKERRDLFSNKCRKITMIHHKCGFQPQPKILANRLIAIFTIPAASLRSTVSLQLIHQMDLSSSGFTSHSWMWDLKQVNISIVCWRPRSWRYIKRVTKINWSL